MDREKTNAYAREWRAANRDRVNAQQRERYRNDPGRYGAQARRGRLRGQGLSEEEYQDLLRQQGGLCAICGKAEAILTRYGATRRLAVDHDHLTNVVRGLLCYRCNTTLGQYELRREAIDAYLERTR